MSQNITDQEIDELVWAIIQDSSNPQDFLDFIRHAENRPAEHELAFACAEQHWDNKDAPRLFPQAVAALGARAEAGDTTAMFHLGRWFRLGYGVTIDTQLGLSWYQKGADLGCARSLINLARYTANEDVPAALEMFKAAAESYGHLAAHCYWADHDKPRYAEHLALGGQSRDPLAQYCWAHHLTKTAATDQEKTSAVECMRNYAEKGNGYACAALGQSFRTGQHGCSVDTETSAYWNKRGANLGNERACLAHGLALLGSSDTREIGVAFLKRAAMLGEPYAQYVLGEQLLNYGPTPEAQAEGVRWLRAACEQNYLPAMSKLAGALENGKGCAPDPLGALYWLEKGSQSGNSECQTALGTCYMYGSLIERNTEKGHNLYHLASLQGNAWATYLLGISYEVGDGTPQSKADAFECYLTAANKGVMSAAYKLGMAYMYGDGTEKDIPAGAKWLYKAAKEGLADAQAYLGTMFVYGHSVEENEQTALYWLKQAAEQNCRQGLRELALLYARDDQSPDKQAEAVRLMANAASQGDTEAAEWIEKNCPQKPQWLTGIEQFVSNNPSDEASDH